MYSPKSILIISQILIIFHIASQLVSADQYYVKSGNEVSDDYEPEYIYEKPTYRRMIVREPRERFVEYEPPAEYYYVDEPVMPPRRPFPRAPVKSYKSYRDIHPPKYYKRKPTFSNPPMSLFEDTDMC